MFYLSNKLIFIYFLLFNSIFNSNTNAFKCDLPEICQIREYGRLNYHYFMSNLCIFCDINNDGFEFKFKEPTSLKTANEKCFFEHGVFKQLSLDRIIFRWMSSDLTILDRQFNFTNLFRFIDYTEGLGFFVDLRYVKGFDVNLLDKIDTNKMINFDIITCQLDFYHNKKKLNSCQDFLDSNLTDIQSIFQITNDFMALYFQVYNGRICPFVFRNTKLTKFEIVNPSYTFYKQNLLSFSTESEVNINSRIKILELTEALNIHLDSNLLNPSVFNHTEDIRILSGCSFISEDVLEHLKNLRRIDIDANSFRRISHKHGIKWIRHWNRDIDVNLSNSDENYSSHKELTIRGSKVSRKFPEEDFCIYVDYPFNQLVIVFYISDVNDEYDYEYSCTYLWLVQYYSTYIHRPIDLYAYENYKYIISFNTTAAFKSISECNFEQKISYCNKSNYRIKDIWDKDDFLILNKKLQAAFKIMLYPTALFGLITNIIVVVVIQLKENSDLFKEFKHFSYLSLNSVFCIMILVIDILSVMNECIFSFGVFCPEIRKLVAIQFFKIIFKECLVTVFRFMCNFTYVAFALNRIGLIGKDHGKLVTFFSEIGIKKYIGITLCISVSLPWINFLKYSVNYIYNDYGDLFPTFEDNIFYYTTNKFIVAYYIINSISNLINYVVFVVVCAIIDICMVVQLRRVLEEKTKKSESLMNQKQNETKKAETEEAVNKAIKMVVLNTAIGVFFKLPVSFIPILNVFAEFFLSFKYRFDYPGFQDFYSTFKDSELYSVIEDVSYFLFTLSLSIQLFIYIRFDKKFRTGFERLMDKLPFRKKTTLNQIK